MTERELMPRPAYIAYAECGCPILKRIAGLSTAHQDRKELEKWISQYGPLQIVVTDDISVSDTQLGCVHRPPTFKQTTLAQVADLLNEVYGC